MKKFFVIMMVVAFTLSLMAMGCGQKEADTHKAPEEVKQAEVADSTALDEAVMDSTMVDSMAAEHDSM
ncbi:MAG TPA: hypothetical protein PLF13_12050 [candidate division Zixibacteria bacterium]|nr:hypothetical protein [candidate division Zixibacteria bacterium]